MPLRAWWGSARELAGAPRARLLAVAPESWREVMQDAAAGGAPLLALWAGNGAPHQRAVCAALMGDAGLLVIWMPVGDGGEYPGIQDLYPAANRMQRAAADLTGIRSSDPDRRPWLRHSAWPADAHPLGSRPMPPPVSPPPIDEYAFVRVLGEGVHEVAVGPVHAGTIEPGHFRFSVVGEKVLRLEERLGYVHKGIERRFSELGLLEGHRLAARVSGDSAVAFSWAYCAGVGGHGAAWPACAGGDVAGAGARTRALRQSSRDLGAIGNDAGFAFGLAQFSRLKEHLLRATLQAFGQRYLLDFIVPGGTRVDLDARGADAHVLV